MEEDDEGAVRERQFERVASYVREGDLPVNRTPPDVLCVYRGRNAPHVRALVAQTEGAGGTPYLWALDRPAEGLEARTRGSGPGLRLAILNALLAHTSGDAPLLVADDDVGFSSGGLRELLDTAHRARLDLAQPAHEPSSHATHRVTRAHLRAVARRTTFVEVGPMVLISARLRPHLTPFPEQYGMGWGLDVVWTDLLGQGWRLGVVDRVLVTHHGPVGAEYDTEPAEAVLAHELAIRGLSGMEALNVTLSTWSARGRFDPRTRWPLWVPTRRGLRRARTATSRATAHSSES